MDKKDQIKYQNDFIKEKYDKMTVAFPKGKKEEYREKAKANGMSLNALINKLLEEN